MKIVIVIGLFCLLLTQCKPNPFPATIQVNPTLDGEKPFLVNLSTGQDWKRIPDNATIIITGPLNNHKWPAIHGSDTGFIYPKFINP
jgi:hypothetical protein